LSHQGEIPSSGWIEVTGRTVEEATLVGLERLGLATADDVEVEVLEEPQRGLLGVFGGRGARIRMRRRPDRLQALSRLALDIARAAGLEDLSVDSFRDDEGYIHINLRGPGLGRLIGRKGETLDALQYLLNLASARMPGRPERVIFDADGYRERRRQTLEALAGRVSARVRRTGREVVLEPMTPQERKIVHLAVAREEGLTSESRGQEPFRRVVVKPAVARAGDTAAGGEGPNER
jgi:spoIIIJ-associated protein